MKTGTIAVIGGGQLCMMMAQAVKKKNLPFRFIAIDPSPNCPAKPFLDELIVGDYKDEEKIEQLAQKADLVTFEIELANSRVLNEIAGNGKPVSPAPNTLKIVQDKYVQAEFLKKNGHPVPACRNFNDRAGLQQAINEMNLPLMIKARKDSYDGRGNFVLKSADSIDEIFSYFGSRSLMAQEFIPFDVEISVIVARNIRGEKVSYPVGENFHGKDYNILKTTIVPARVPEGIVQNAKKIAEEVMESFQGVGVFGIEMFVTGDAILINEIAPRVHNTGHFTIEACATSQFENHVRAISGMELGNTRLTCPSVVMHNIIGGPKDFGPYTLLFNGKSLTGISTIDAGAFVHHYHKSDVKPFRKMGHLTVVANPNESQEELILRAEKLLQKIHIVPFNKRLQYFNPYKKRKNSTVLSGGNYS